MEGDFCLNNADGDGVWLHTTCAPVLGPDGETCKVVVIGSDLRAQKAEALHNEGYVQATQRSQGGVELTPEGEILTANEIFLDALGLDLFDLLGEHDSILLP